MKYQFYTCDVFTDVRFAGNPLAVLPNSDGLSSRQMQQIAREFNYSESTFVLPSHDEYTRNVRIFTPTQEVPFAGHPNIGTAFTLASIGELGSFDNETNVVFEEIAGPVPIRIRRMNSEIWCELKAPETLIVEQTVSTDLIASALSLTPKDVVIDTHLPLVVSVGLPFIVVELKNRTALENTRCHLPAVDEIHSKGIVTDILTYVRSEDEFDIRARVFAPLDGVPEDPATGSANCALVALLTHCMSKEEGEFSWRIAQGVEMERPSVLDARTKKQSGVITGVWIAGSCKMVSEGYIEI
jgi:trans-2,3-dihydro-3-hydroxyanthranilate isomerase